MAPRIVASRILDNIPGCFGANFVWNANWDKNLIPGIINFHLHLLMLRCRLFRSFSTDSDRMNKIRNIGIIAHIDAGKTTTTERMLYYAGVTRRIGEVDRGDTVMDYLAEERARGITIQSAAITFPWKGHTINLIDTPGHVDFSFEVERSLRVLDGAVTILDGRAGIQAQTRTVWRQADRFSIPRIIYVNKVDKAGSDYKRCLEQVERVLGMPVLALQRPLNEGSGSTIQIVDILNGQLLSWEGDDKGLEISRKAIDTGTERTALYEKIAGLDDQFLEIYLGGGGKEDIDLAGEAKQAMARLSGGRRAVVALCGASYQNCGVQPLLDAITEYLPPPPSPPPARIASTAEMLAFKCIYDPQKGFIIFVRIYSGTYQSKTALHNRTLGMQERPTRLMQAVAGSFEEVGELSAGSIGVLMGLKGTRTGDILSTSKSPKEDVISPTISIKVPPAVFFCSVEPESSAEEGRLQTALEIIQREDPSIRVTTDPESGQTLVAGIGELHLDIVQKRVRRDLGVKAGFGRVQIGYRERLVSPVAGSLNFDKLAAPGVHLQASVTLSLEPRDEADNNVEIKGSSADQDDLAMVRNAMESCLMSSPISRHALSHTALTLTIHAHTSTASACQAGQHLFRSLLTENSHLLERLEPVMAVEIETPASYVGSILNDIHAKRRGAVNVVREHGGGAMSVVEAEVPLAEILGYASYLRSITQGNASYTLSPKGYQPVSP